MGNLAKGRIMSVLVTGSAGFIGYHVARSLLQKGRSVIGVDNLNDYYDVRLKRARNAMLKQYPRYVFYRADLSKPPAVDRIFSKHRIRQVCHLAAQAGVRYSLVNPKIYLECNVDGMLNLLEACRRHPVRHFVFSSSSSVYGAGGKVPFSVHDSTDHPVSLYAATKKTGELMGHVYAHLFGMPVTALRFFTVYGPWGRPDMAYFDFTKKILAGEPIPVFNRGRMKRDFTYVDDVVRCVVRVLQCPPKPKGRAPYRVLNVGNNRPVSLLRFIQVLENCLGKPVKKSFRPMQPGDVPETAADIRDTTRLTGFKPSTSIETGLERFVRWYAGYYAEGAG